MSATALTQQTSYNPKLPPPAGLVVTKVSGGYRLDFSEVPGAVSYAYTNDNGSSWSNSYTDTSKLIAPGAIVPASVGANIRVRALNAINDMGIPVNPGTPSDPVVIAA